MPVTDFKIHSGEKVTYFKGKHEILEEMPVSNRLLQ